MFQYKYLIIIAAIIVLCVMYYYYDELSSLKKTSKPTYQKVMALEARVLELEKKAVSNLSYNTAKIIASTLPSTRKKPSKYSTGVESQVYSITYDSPVNTNDNVSIKYGTISDSEVRKIKESRKTKTQPSGEKDSTHQNSSSKNLLGEFFETLDANGSKKKSYLSDRLSDRLSGKLKFVKHSPNISSDDSEASTFGVKKSDLVDKQFPSNGSIPLNSKEGTNLLEIVEKLEPLNATPEKTTRISNDGSDQKEAWLSELERDSDLDFTAKINVSKTDDDIFDNRYGIDMLDDLLFG